MHDTNIQKFEVKDLVQHSPGTTIGGFMANTHSSVYESDKWVYICEGTVLSASTEIGTIKQPIYTLQVSDPKSLALKPITPNEALGGIKKSEPGTHASDNASFHREFMPHAQRLKGLVPHDPTVLSHLQHDPVQWKQHCTPYGRCYNVCDITVKVTPDSSCELSVTVIVLDTLDSYPNNFLDAVRVLCVRQISVSLAHSETFTIVVCLKQCMTSGPVEAGHGVAQTLPHYYFVNALGKVFWCVRDADLTNLKPHPRHSAEWLRCLDFLRHMENFPPQELDFSSNLPELLHKFILCAMAEHLIEPEQAQSLQSLVHSFPRDFHFWFIAMNLRTSMSPDSRDDDEPNHLLDLVDLVISFGTYRNYLKFLRNIWSDRHITPAEWRNLQDLLQCNWDSSNLLASILLSTNMGFLVIGGVTMREMVFSIISTFLATASIITGLYNTVNLGRVQARCDRDSVLGDTYFQNAANLDNNRLYALAFFLALPTILLLWSAVTFACAIAVFAFTSQRPVILSIVSEASFGVLVTLTSVLCCFWLVFKYKAISNSKQTIPTVTTWHPVNPKENLGE